jgi:putative transposase
LIVTVFVSVRTGSLFPALLCPWRRIDVVVMQAYVEGVSTRRVDDLVIATGGTGIVRARSPGSARARR